MKFNEGDRVDYVVKGLSQQPGVMATSLGAGYVSADSDDALEDGARKRAVIDKIVDERTVRIILTDSMETVWAHPDEIEALGAIDRMADMVGPESRSFKDGLEELDEED